MERYEKGSVYIVLQQEIGYATHSGVATYRPINITVSRGVIGFDHLEQLRSLTSKDEYQDFIDLLHSEGYERVDEIPLAEVIRTNSVDIKEWMDGFGRV